MERPVADLPDASGDADQRPGQGFDLAHYIGYWLSRGGAGGKHRGRSHPVRTGSAIILVDRLEEHEQLRLQDQVELSL
jgi:hypothetical protein